MSQKSAVIHCILINGAIGFSVSYSFDLFVMDLMKSPYFFSNIPLLAMFLCSANLIAVLFTIFSYTSKARYMGTLYLFYISSQFYALSSFSILAIPLSFPYMSQGTYYVLLWFLFVVLASCSSILILLVYTFTYNSCYSHERLMVMRWVVSAFLLGSLLGSCIASSSFEFSEWFREIYHIQIQISWVLSIVTVKMFLTLKIQGTCPPEWRLSFSGPIVSPECLY